MSDPGLRDVRKNIQKKQRARSTRRSKRLLIEQSPELLAQTPASVAINFNRTLQSRANLEKALNKDMIKANKELEKTVAGFSATAFAGKALNKVFKEITQFTDAIEKGFKKNLIPVLSSLETLGEIFGRRFLPMFEDWSKVLDKNITDELRRQDNLLIEAQIMDFIAANVEELTDLLGIQASIFQNTAVVVFEKVLESLGFANVIGGLDLSEDPFEESEQLLAILAELIRLEGLDEADSKVVDAILITNDLLANLIYVNERMVDRTFNPTGPTGGGDLFGGLFRVNRGVIE